jgi:very-short-patch-repair endonuclease
MTLRFWDNEALQQTDAILETIPRAVMDWISTS